MVLQDTVRLLTLIQKIDIEIDVTKKETACLEGELGGEKEALSSTEAALTELEGGIIELDREVREREEILREKKERIAKDQKRLGEIKNEKQLNALTKEITDAEKASKLLEIELTSLREKIEKKKADISDCEVRLAGKAALVKTKEEGLERKKADSENTLKKKEAERASLASQVNPQILKKYDTIKSKRAGVAIVNVKKETCQGCFIQIPPQVYIQLKKGSEELITCPHCHRLLYFEKEPA
jgi:predicted  nucleic acid-binding Zn-ribbon protein